MERGVRHRDGAPDSGGGAQTCQRHAMLSAPIAWAPHRETLGSAVSRDPEKEVDGERDRWHTGLRETRGLCSGWVVAAFPESGAWRRTERIMGKSRLC